MLASLFADCFLTVVSSDGKASTDGIRQDLGMCLMRNGYHPF